MRTFTLTGSGRFAMLSLPLLPGEQRSARYAAMNTIWLHGSPKLKPSQSSFGFCVCVCVCTGATDASDSSHAVGADGVQPGSGAEEDEAPPR